MAKFYTSKFGTKINIEGLSPEQIQKVKGFADQKYGDKATVMANTFRKNMGPQAQTGGPATDVPRAQNPNKTKKGQAGSNLGALGKTGVDNFLEGIFQNIQPPDISGAPKILTGDDLAASRQSVYDSIYNQNTKNLERNQQRELEQERQMLAERGIPLNAGGEDLYSKTIGGVKERYDSLYNDAANQANIGADQSLAVQAGVNKTAHDAFMEEATNKFNAQLDAATVGGDILKTLIQNYGLTREEAIAKRDDMTRRYLGRLAASSGGAAAPATTAFSGEPIITG